MPVVDLKLTGRRLGQEGLARAARSIQENAVLNHPVLFEPLGMKPVLYDRVDAPLLLLHPADGRERPRRDVGPSGLAVLPAARSPCGDLDPTAVWPAADYEDQAASSGQRKYQPIRQFERGSAVAGNHHTRHRVFVE